MCVWGGGGGEREGRGNKFHKIENNLHAKNYVFLLTPLFLFNPTFKCLQVLVKAKKLGLHI